MNGQKDVEEQGPEFSNTDRNCKMIKIDEIKTVDIFETLFSINQTLLDSITASMQKNGYDNSQPVTVWIYEQDKIYLVDGHTRLQAAKKAGLKKIPATVLHFKNFEDAQFYCLKRQALRRSLSPKEILQAVVLLKNKQHRDGTGRSVEIMGKELGLSASSIMHAKTVVENASDEDINDIKNGKTSINKVYQKLREEKSSKEAIDNIAPSAEITKEEGSETNKEAEAELEQLVYPAKPILKDLYEIIRLLYKHNEMSAVSILREEYKFNVI